MLHLQKEEIKNLAYPALERISQITNLIDNRRGHVFLSTMPENTTPQAPEEKVWVVVKNGARVCGPMTLPEAEAEASRIRTLLTEAEAAKGADVAVLRNIMG